MKTNIQYFKVVPARQDYKGNRLFKYDYSAEKVVQVTVNQGETKRGRAACFGVGLIARISFLANYLSMGYVQPCSKREYDKNFNQVVEYLK